MLHIVKKKFFAENDTFGVFLIFRPEKGCEGKSCFSWKTAHALWNDLKNVKKILLEIRIASTVHKSSFDFSYFR
jgi:hypothetical protein